MTKSQFRQLCLLFTTGNPNYILLKPDLSQVPKYCFEDRLSICGYPTIGHRLDIHMLIYFNLVSFFLIEIQLAHNVTWVSGVQHSDSRSQYILLCLQVWLLSVTIQCCSNITDNIPYAEPFIAIIYSSRYLEDYLPLPFTRLPFLPLWQSSVCSLYLWFAF